MPINKVEFANETLIDISDSTVTEDTLLEGTKAYKADGTAIIGTYVPQEPPRYIWDSGFTFMVNGANPNLSVDSWWTSGTLTKVSVSEGLSSQHGLEFYLISDGTLGVKWYIDPTATPSTIYIPDSITLDGKTYPVSELGTAAFKGAVFLVNLWLTDNIKYIASDALENCFNLQNDIYISEYSQNVAVVDPGIEFVLTEIANGSY